MIEFGEIPSLWTPEKLKRKAHLQEGLEAPDPFCILCSMHLFHMTVLKIVPFYNKLVIQSVKHFFEFCEQINWNLGGKVLETSNLWAVGQKHRYLQWLLKWGQSCVTEFLICGICCYLQIDSAGIDLAGVSVCRRGEKREGKRYPHPSLTSTYIGILTRQIDTSNLC